LKKSILISVILLLAAALFAGIFILSRLNGAVHSSSDYSIAFAMLVVLAVALFIVVRRPQNAVGWILLAGSFSMYFTQLITLWARFTLVTQPGALPLGMAAAWASLWVWAVMMYFLFILLPLLFPTGRPISAKWRPVVWLTGFGMVVLILAFGLAPGPMEDLEPLRNPLGLEVMAPFIGVIEVLSSLILLLLIGLALLSVLVRYRLSRGEERAQMKWFLFAAAFLFANAFRGITTDLFGLFPPVPRVLEDWVISLNIILIAVAIGVAILKYRLYEIDVIIRRTLIYGSITVILALVYYASVLLMQGLIPSVTGQNSQIAIVLSTLVIAALFTPLRRRIQTIIDRRFYRSKYNAEGILSSFSARLQDEVDPDQISGRLIAVVEETLQPEQVSIWLSDRG
jgi:hypothetical protein